MRYIIVNCSTSRDHPLHVGDPKPSMYSCVDGLERRVCPGGRAGDAAIREGSVKEIVAQYDRDNGQDLLVALAVATGKPIDRTPRPPAPLVDEPVEPWPDDDMADIESVRIYGR